MTVKTQFYFIFIRAPSQKFWIFELYRRILLYIEFHLMTGNTGGFSFLEWKPGGNADLVSFSGKNTYWMEISSRILALMARVTHSYIISSELKFKVFLPRLWSFLMAEFTIFTRPMGVDDFLLGCRHFFTNPREIPTA